MALKNIDGHRPQYAVSKRSADWLGEVTVSPELMKDLLRIAKSSFEPHVPEKNIERMVSGNSMLLIASKAQTKERIGFAGAFYDENEYYFSTAAIIRSEQGNGLYHLFNRLRIRDGINRGFRIFTVTTQNPRVEHSIDRAMDSLINDGLILGYAVQRSMIRGYYGMRITPESQRCSDERVNMEFSRLRPEKGDAFNVAFSVKPRPLFSRLLYST